MILFEQAKVIPVPGAVDVLKAVGFHCEFEETSEKSNLEEFLKISEPKVSQALLFGILSKAIDRLNIVLEKLVRVRPAGR